MGAPWHLHRDRFAAARVVVRSSHSASAHAPSPPVMIVRNSTSGSSPN
jgi:hypothetical protein